MQVSKIVIVCLMVIPLLADTATHSLAVAEFESRLRATDCSNVATERSIDLHIMGRSFPLTNGYQFHGFELGDAVFRKKPDGDIRDYSKRHPSKSPTAISRDWNASQASVSYFKRSNEIDRDDEPSQGFDTLVWDGLILYVRRSVGKRNEQVIAHQVIVRSNDDDDVLRIASTNPQLIADVVACSSQN